MLSKCIGCDEFIEDAELTEALGILERRERGERVALINHLTFFLPFSFFFFFPPRWDVALGLFRMFSLQKPHRRPVRLA
jgi:hypothetical protein